MGLAEYFGEEVDKNIFASQSGVGKVYQESFTIL